MNTHTLFFVSDLHGKENRYHKLFQAIEKEKPGIVLLGGDLLPAGIVKSILKKNSYYDFINDFFKKYLLELKSRLEDHYPVIGVILGNDDPRAEEHALIELEKMQLIKYLHFRQIKYNEFTVIGYSYVPPTPFRLKDWERYDVSRFVDPGCTPPYEGIRTVEVSDYEMEYTTIQKDIEQLTLTADMDKTIMLFHSPPYNSLLDRAALDGMTYEHVPLDVHVGSIAIQRFIETKQPFLTLHGHIHESSRLTGHWKQQFGKTWSFNAAYENDELSLIKINLLNPQNAIREIL